MTSSVISTSNYEIRISADKKTLESWTSNRLVYAPFPEHKRWQIEYRDTLRSCLKELKKPIYNLYALYSSSKDKEESFDVENILFYNVDDGYKSFLDLPQYSIEFERNIEPPPLNKNFNHYVYYSAKKSIPYWRPKTFLTEWENIGCGDFKLEKVWLEMKRGNIKVINNYGGETKLGLEINIQAQRYLEQRKINLVSILKPFVDGICASFSYHDGTNLEVVERVLNQRTSVNPNLLRNLVIENKNAIFGKRKLFWARMNGIQWNPFDDCILYCHIKINYSTDDFCKHSGTLFTLK